MPRRQLRTAVRLRVAARQGWQCCGELCAPHGRLLPAEFQVHHVESHALTADDDERNLRALCASCHAVHTSREAAWISIARAVREHSVCLCVQCKVVYSPHFPHRDCPGWRETSYEAARRVVRGDLRASEFSTLHRRAFPPP